MTHLTYRDYLKIKDLKTLDLQVCDFCSQLNILNLGWNPFKRLYCLTDEREHVLCEPLCYKIALRILGCQLYKKEQEITRESQTTNRKYNQSNCYFCFQKLNGAGKHGIVKNRNNSSFWGLAERFIGCLKCLKKKHYFKLTESKRKTLNKYVKRGYI